MLLMPCSLANHFISRKDVGIPLPASLSSITHLKLVVLPVICPYIQQKRLLIFAIGIIAYIITSKLIIKLSLLFFYSFFSAGAFNLNFFTSYLLADCTCFSY